MNKILVLIVGLIYSIMVFGQTTFYYCYDKKIEITVNPDKETCFYAKEDSVALKRMKSAFSGLIDARAECEHAHIIIYNYPTESDARLSKQRLVADTITNRHKVWPCYKFNGYDLYLMSGLGVTIKKDADYDLITTFMEKYKLKMDKVSEINPLRYYMDITVESPGNALEIANEIFETGLVTEAHPLFWMDMFQ